MESVRKWSRSCTEDLCSYFLLEVYGISEEMEKELHRGLMLILPIKSVWNQWGNGSGAPQRIYAYTLYWECIASVRKWSRSCPDEFCSNSLLEVYQISNEMDQELHRGFMFISSIKNVWNQWGNGQEAPPRTYAYIPYRKCMESIRKWTRSCTKDFCSYWGNAPGAAQRIHACILDWKCMESVRKWRRSSTADLCFSQIVRKATRGKHLLEKLSLKSVSKYTYLGLETMNFTNST